MVDQEEIEMVALKKAEGNNPRLSASRSAIWQDLQVVRDAAIARGRSTRYDPKEKVSANSGGDVDRSEQPARRGK